MTDELAARRAAQLQQPSGGGEEILAGALAESRDLNGRLADELERLGEGVERLRDEWAKDDQLRHAADRLNDLLRGRRRR